MGCSTCGGKGKVLIINKKTQDPHTGGYGLDVIPCPECGGDSNPKATKIPAIRIVNPFLLPNPRRMKEPHIYHTTCKRCGEQIASSRWAMSHPLGRICGKCITKDEKEQILQYQSGVILKRGRRNPYTASDILKAHKALCYSRGYTSKVVGAYDYENRRLYKGRRNHCRLWGSKNHGELMEVYDSKVGKKELIDVGEWLEKYPKTLDKKDRNPVDLYESFHGVPPVKKTTVFYEPPPGELIAIGELTQVNYRPRRGQHSKTEFYHKSGDTGEKMLTSNLILCTDKAGRNLYLVRKNKNSKYPVFSERGILG